MASPPLPLRIDRRLVARVLGATVGFFVIVNLGWETLARQMEWEPNTTAFYLFDLDAEKNIATGFAALLLLIAGVLVAVIALAKRQQKDRFTLGWAVLAFGLHFMAVDELVSLHERLIRPMRDVLGWEDLGILYFAWVVPGAVLLVILAVAYWRFIRHLPRASQRGFLLAAAIFIGGGLGVELIGGRHVETWGHLGLRYQIITTTEEALEMSGMVVFIHALLGYMAAEFGEMGFAFGNGRIDDEIEVAAEGEEVSTAACSS